jgi:hypothetical protein
MLMFRSKWELAVLELVRSSGASSSALPALTCMWRIAVHAAAGV